MTSQHDDPKSRRPRSGAVREDGVSPTGARRAPADRLVDRPGGRDAPLETYEQQAPRETDDPRKAEDGAVNRSAKDEP